MLCVGCMGLGGLRLFQVGKGGSVEGWGFGDLPCEVFVVIGSQDLIGQIYLLARIRLWRSELLGMFMMR
jgi:hypothetical protein